ncbi:MAG: acetyl-CoA synthetase [Acidimicrobiales bacterium]
MDGRAPCLIGVAQRTVLPGQGPAPEPLALWEEVCRAAAGDTGARVERVLGAAGSLDVLYCQSWPYDDPAGRLAERLGIRPGRRAYSGIGGTTPHLLLAGAAGAVARGELDVALVVGGESLATVRQAKRAGERPAWSHRDPDKKPFPFEAPFHPAEVAHSVFQAWLTFALFDVARRAHLGADPKEYRQALGDMLAPMTEVAESNPHAWFRQRRTAAELIEPTPANRMVGYPYTKTTVAVMDVDMAAALIVASHDAADALGVPGDRRVYLRGSGYAEDPVYVAEHDPMWSSPAMAVAARASLTGAGVDIDQVAHLDLYSCFGSSLNFACDSLGLRPDDPRGLTVTGGLPFAGGPGSGYMLHSTAGMVEALRADPGSYGLVTGVGMHMTKHAFGVYSSAPPDRAGLARLAGAPSAGSVAPAASIGAGAGPPSGPVGGGPSGNSGPPRVITDTYTGTATVAAYSVVHAPSGERDWGLAVCDLPDGSRTYARMEGLDLLEQAEETELVGAEVYLEAGGDNVNRVRS